MRNVFVRPCILSAFLTFAGIISTSSGQFLPGVDDPSFLPPRLRSRNDGRLAVLGLSPDRRDAADDTPPSPGLDDDTDDTPPSPGLDDDTDAAKPKVRIANAEALARARQFIEYGDARFRQQQFADAYQRYRKAAESAPNLADAYFREAFAQAALGRYRPAVNSIRRGLALEPEWATKPLRLQQLYDRNRAAKETHFERLALAAGDEPESGELMFLLGVELLCDDQPDQARTFLLRAAHLGLEKKIVQGFLDAAVRQSKRKPRGEEL